MQRPPSHAQQHFQGQLTGVSPSIITERLQNGNRKITSTKLEFTCWKLA